MTRISDRDYDEAEARAEKAEAWAEKAETRAEKAEAELVKAEDRAWVTEANRSIIWAKAVKMEAVVKAAKAYVSPPYPDGVNPEDLYGDLCVALNALEKG